MAESDSDDSFHSAEDVGESIEHRDGAVRSELANLTMTANVTADQAATLAAHLECLSWSDKIHSDLHIDQLLKTEQKDIPEKLAKTLAAAPESVASCHQPPLAGQCHAILSASTTTAQASPASSWSPPTKQEQAESEDDPPAEELDDSLIRLTSLSHSSSSSTNSAGEKESGSELKEWDRLSGNNDEFGTLTQDRVATSSGDVDESLVDDWESGWDETDVTEDDMLQAVTASEPSKPSTTSDVRPTVLPVKKVVPALKGSEDLTAAASVAARQPQTGLWGKWGGWGTTLLTTAVGQVGQGLNAVMDTVEQSLGAPRPEELAARGSTAEKTDDAVQKKREGPPPSESDSTPPSESGSSTGWLAGLTTKVQSGGLHLVSNSLDVLEGLGKKTMQVVGEQDPGFRQTKAVLSGRINQPILSQVLREAKSSRFDETGERNTGPREEPISFVNFFDEEQGTGSWEALELLSSQCAQRVEAHEASDASDPVKRDMFERLERLCRASEYDDSPRGDEEDITELILREYTRLGLGLAKPHALLHVFRTAADFLKDNAKAPTTDEELWRRNVHRSGVRTFAACTAKSLEQIRKTTETIFLAPSQDAPGLLRRVETLHALVGLFCRHLDRLANQYAACLALATTASASPAPLSSSKPAAASAQMTELFVEASNSNRYIQDGLQLCLAIFKLAWLNGHT